MGERPEQGLHVGGRVAGLQCAGVRAPCGRGESHCESEWDRPVAVREGEWGAAVCGIVGEPGP